jgi:hypothetical protein
VPAVIVESIPLSKPDAPPIGCLADGENPDDCTFQASPGPLPFEELVRAEADASDAVWTMDLDPLVCPRLPTCDPVVNDAIVMYDSHHLTGRFAATLADPIEAWMVDNGVLEGR